MTPTVLELVVLGASQKYPTPEAWPPAKPWYALRDGVQRLREEAMKTAMFLEPVDDADLVPLEGPLRQIMPPSVVCSLDVSVPHKERRVSGGCFFCLRRTG